MTAEAPALTTQSVGAGEARDSWWVAPCPYCDDPSDARSPEHVFPRSIGGDPFVVYAHERCNQLANNEIDMPLRNCAHVSAARAAAGLRCSRRGQPHRHQLDGEVLAAVELPAGLQVDHHDASQLLDVFRTCSDFGGRGARVAACRSGDQFEVTFRGNRVAEPDGTFSVFADAGDGVDHDGPGTTQVLTLVELGRPCAHPEATWSRFTAKAGLALLSLIPGSRQSLGDGTVVGELLSPDDIRRLRDHLLGVAFGASSSDEGLPREPYAVARAAESLTHAVALIPSGDGSTVLVRLFGHLHYRLDVEDIDLRSDVGIEFPVARTRRAPA